MNRSRAGSDEPIVSVCIANFNGIDVIDECLRSVLQQEGDIPIEILIHDDASSDGSAAHIRNEYPDVRLIESAENVGFCIANNRMAAEANGKYLLLLNNDAALFPDALKTLLVEAERLARPAILGVPQYNAETGELIDIGSLLDPFLNPVPNKDPGRSAVGMVMGACLWVPRTLWLELGGFPEWFGSIGEDLYLCCRARLAGHRVNAIGTSGYRHHVGQSFGGGKVRQGKLVTTYRRRALSERNRTFVMLLTYPTSMLLALLPLHIATIFLEGALLALIKRSPSAWLVIYAPLLPAVWRERERLVALRNEIQGIKEITTRSFLGPFRGMPWKLEMLVKHGPPEIK
ncbi:glycosyltransferase [Propionivibrio sp.]|uniref:glycosyltransferase family 2 protein n=1 Tax=Propionivibrio sp. TaxID=2212460 RepID=UPI0025F4E657|nr:glycosyltransferase [Propionivibrio sp.]MBK8743235.1 glycosyltransferase [Propionivibrio sp.]